MQIADAQQISHWASLVGGSRVGNAPAVKLCGSLSASMPRARKLLTVVSVMPIPLLARDAGHPLGDLVEAVESGFDPDRFTGAGSLQSELHPA